MQFEFCISMKKDEDNIIPNEDKSNEDTKQIKSYQRFSIVKLMLLSMIITKAAR
jgi:hypothetical protein